jgi:hypothetical protein
MIVVPLEHAGKRSARSASGLLVFSEMWLRTTILFTLPPDPARHVLSRSALSFGKGNAVRRNIVTLQHVDIRPGNPKSPA